MRKTFVAFRADAGQLDRLETIQKQTGETLSEVLRRAVDNLPIATPCVIVSKEAKSDVTRQGLHVAFPE